MVRIDSLELINLELIVWEKSASQKLLHWASFSIWTVLRSCYRIDKFKKKIQFFIIFFFFSLFIYLYFPDKSHAFISFSIFYRIVSHKVYLFLTVFRGHPLYTTGKFLIFLLLSSPMSHFVTLQWPPPTLFHHYDITFIAIVHLEIILIKMTITLTKSYEKPLILTCLSLSETLKKFLYIYF